MDVAPMLLACFLPNSSDYTNLFQSCQRGCEKGISGLQLAEELQPARWAIKKGPGPIASELQGHRNVPPRKKRGLLLPLRQIPCRWELRTSPLRGAWPRFLLIFGAR